MTSMNPALGWILRTPCGLFYNMDIWTTVIWPGFGRYHQLFEKRQVQIQALALLYQLTMRRWFVPLQRKSSSNWTTSLRVKRLCGYCHTWSAMPLDLAGVSFRFLCLWVKLRRRGREEEEVTGAYWERDKISHSRHHFPHPINTFLGKEIKLCYNSYYFVKISWYSTNMGGPEVICGVRLWRTICREQRKLCEELWDNGQCAGRRGPRPML